MPNRRSRRSRAARNRRTDLLPLGGVAFVLALPLIAFAGSAHGAPTPAASPFTVAVAATPSSGSVPLTVALTATVSSGTPTSVAWTFGDGAVWDGTGAAALSVTHRYTGVGSFVAVAQVTEAAGVVSGSTTVAVENGPVVAAISATPSGGSAPLSVVFRAVVSGGTGTYTSFDWTFGDGSSAAGPVVSHTFHGAGSYSVALAVTDSANTSVAVTFALSVTAAPASSPWNAYGLATIASVGVAGAGLTYGVIYAGRRRRTQRARVDDVDEYGRVPPGAIGPLADPLGTPLLAAQDAEASSAGAIAESLPVVSTSRPSSPVPATAPPLLPGTAPASSPKPVPAAEPRRWSRDLVAYLGSLPTLGPDDIPTLAWTQKGMSDRLGTGQNQVSNVLRRLVGAGLVVEELQHVQGQPRRLKVYRLSLRGEALAREMRRSRLGASRDYLKREW